MKRPSAFTLVEAMVVLAIFGLVTAAASMSFVIILQSAKKGRGAVQAMGGTRTTLDFILDEARNVGGPDLPASARVLIDKSGGQKNTDVVWMLRQNTGYTVCAVVNATSTTLEFPTAVVSGVRRCCFEAQPPEAGIADISGNLDGGPAFRRTAVISDLKDRFLPVFLQGDPNATNCRLQIKELPGIDRVINAGIGNRPDIGIGASVVLADVKRFYVDYDAEGVNAPFGATYVQVELDGNVDSFLDERQRLSSNTLDFRAAVGYDRRNPDIPDIEPEDDPDDDAFSDDDPSAADAIPDVPEGNQPLLERTGDRGGWRNTPIPVTADNLAPPTMLGIALQTGVGGDQPPPPLPWTVVPLEGEPRVQVLNLVGRVTFRSEGP